MHNETDVWVIFRSYHKEYRKNIETARELLEYKIVLK